MYWRSLNQSKLHQNLFNNLSFSPCQKQRHTLHQNLYNNISFSPCQKQRHTLHQNLLHYLLFSWENMFREKTMSLLEAKTHTLIKNYLLNYLLFSSENSVEEKNLNSWRKILNSFEEKKKNCLEIFLQDLRKKLILFTIKD